jgi:N-acetylglucosamine kinase-like BadF-type ATPase
MFLGIDGGGTKTSLCLIDLDGTVRGRVRMPGSYPFADADGVGRVAEVLAAGVREVNRVAGIGLDDIHYTFAGLPTFGEWAGSEEALSGAVATVLGTDRFSCGDDSVAAWAGSLGARDGINVIAGTGSMSYGVWNGRSVRVGGWGEIFGDEGSAYWIAARALQAFSMMADGREPRGELYTAVRARLGIDRDLDAVGVVHGDWAGRRDRVAALAPVVSTVAAADPAAARILQDAGRALARLAAVAATRIGCPAGDETRVSTSGSVFGAEEVRAAFAQSLSDEPHAFALAAPMLPPDAGAAAYAARLSGTPLSDAALSRLATVAAAA